MFAKGTRQRRTGIESAFQRNFRQREPVFVDQFQRAQQFSALQKGEHGFAGQRAKDAVKVERRNSCQSGQRFGRPFVARTVNDRLDDLVDSIAVLVFEHARSLAPEPNIWLGKSCALIGSLFPDDFAADNCRHRSAFQFPAVKWCVAAFGL